VLAFRDNVFPNPEGLIGLIAQEAPTMRVRPDQKLVVFNDWEQPAARLKGTAAVLRRLVGIAERAKAA
jgi:transcription-repair coupling factor (superfamily II helicase)